MLEIKVKVTFDDEIKDMLGAIAKMVSVDTCEVAEVAEKVECEGVEAVHCGSESVAEAAEHKEKTITIDEIRSVATKLIKNNRRDELKKVLSSLGVMRIVDINESDYTAVHDRLNGLLEDAGA